MTFLAKNEYVLSVFGYGWNDKRGGIFPFAITEFADAGTLKDFLRAKEVPLHERLLPRCDVARGLDALHGCNIAHGDLKLENVFVTLPSGNSLLSRNPFLNRATACISDFGHHRSTFLLKEATAAMNGMAEHYHTMPRNVLKPQQSKGGNWTIESATSGQWVFFVGKRSSMARNITKDPAGSLETCVGGERSRGFGESEQRAAPPGA